RQVLDWFLDWFRGRECPVVSGFVFALDGPPSSGNPCQSCVCDDTAGTWRAPCEAGEKSPSHLRISPPPPRRPSAFRQARETLHLQRAMPSVRDGGWRTEAPPRRRAGRRVAVSAPPESTHRSPSRPSSAASS